MYDRKSVYLVVLVLVASALACNLPMGGPRPTPAPTDAGFAVPTQPGATAAPVDPAAPANPAETPAAGQPAPVEPGAGAQATPENNKFTLATTDTLISTGLLNRLLADFQQKTGYEVKVEGGGAGRAFRLGEKFVADILLVNDPGTEQKYLKDGFASEREIVMHGDYVLLGPADDPAGVKGSANAVEALKKIAAQQAKFVTYGKEFPVSIREDRLWKDSGLTPAGKWFIESDQGVAGTLKIASDKGAYVLAPRTDHLDTKSKGVSTLEVLLEGDPALFDIYHVLPGNPQKSPKINVAGVQAFKEYILSPEAQAIIAAFGTDVYGQPVFFGDAGKGDY